MSPRVTALVLAGAVVMHGCAISPKQFVGPNGRPAYSMDCGGAVDRCYALAGELCKGGYTIINSTSGTQIITNPANRQTIGIPQTNIAIECK